MPWLHVGERKATASREPDDFRLHFMSLFIRELSPQRAVPFIIIMETASQLLLFDRPILLYRIKGHLCVSVASSCTTFLKNNHLLFDFCFRSLHYATEETVYRQATNDSSFAPTEHAWCPTWVTSPCLRMSPKSLDPLRPVVLMPTA